MVAKTIASLQRQTWLPDAIYLWLPEGRFNRDRFAYAFPAVEIRAGPDLGPAMKLLPTLKHETDPDTCIITVDDDVEYPPELVDKLVRASALLPNHAIGFTGWSVIEGFSGAGFSGAARLAHMNENTSNCAFFQQVQVLEGTRGILYRRRFFADDVFKHLQALEAFRYHDDILFSGYIASRGIVRSVRWFHPCPRQGMSHWRIHCQDSGLHTTKNWYQLGWDCWSYWSTEDFVGIGPPFSTPARDRRLQIGGEACHHGGFIQYPPGQAETPLESMRELDKLPWPWPDQGFDEVLVGDAVIRGSIDVESWISECSRILSPGGALKITIPMRAELYALTGRGAGLDLDPNTFCEIMQPSRHLADPSSTPPTASLSLPKLRILVESYANEFTAILIAPGK